MTKITIIALVSDDKDITLYKDDGDTITLHPSDYNTEKIVKDIVPKLAKDKKATIEISSYEIHKKVEESSSGVIKFFRMAKSIFKPSGWFQSTQEYDKNQKDESYVPAPQIEAAYVEQNASKEIPKNLPKEDTVVAVVDNKVIPGVEKIQAQITRSSLTSTKGMENFMKRIASVIDKRQHSIEDLLKFLEKADLPIAEDGSVIAYKALKSITDGYFADCHTGKVTQKVGSHVFMHESLVDRNRGQDCSNGLHIARRSYLSGFSGDTIVIAKIAPEDFIAVPHYDPSKVRVCGYHIVAEVNKKAYSLLKSNKSMTSDKESAELLHNIIIGNHTVVTETVEIKGNRGSNVTVTQISEAKPVNLVKESTESILEVEDNPALQTNKDVITSAKINELKEKSQKQKTKPKEEIKAKPKSIKEEVRELYDLWIKTKDDNHRQRIIFLKKEKRKSFAGLGLTPQEQILIEESPAKSPIKQPKSTETKPALVVKAEPKKENKPMTIKEEAHAHFKAKRFFALSEFAKSKKKSLKSLGFTETEINVIQSKI